LIDNAIKICKINGDNI